MAEHLLKDLEVLISKQTASIKQFFTIKIEKIERILSHRAQKADSFENELRLAQNEIKMLKNETLVIQKRLEALGEDNKTLKAQLDTERLANTKRSIAKTKEIKNQLQQSTPAAEESPKNDTSLET